jgi:outer membrane protein assembly factor BamB
MTLRPVLLLVLTSITSSVIAQRTSWPMINGDAMRTSRAEIELSFPLKIADTWDIGFNSEQGMIVTEDYLFLSDAADSNILKTIDARTGELLWQFGVPGTGGSASFIPATWQHLVIAGGQSAAGVYALEIETGAVQWFKPTGSSYTRNPIITDGLLLIPGAESLLCVDLANGVDQWSIPGFIPQISPAADSSHVYFGKENEVYSVSKWTGELAWKTTVPNGTFSSYTLDDERLFVSEYRTEINALNKLDGSILWTVTIDTNETMMLYPSCFAQTGDNLLVKFFVNGDDRNHYMILNKETGDEINRFEGGVMNYTSPTIINDYLVDIGAGNLLFLTLPAGDTAYWTSIPDFGGVPQVIAANDRIYIGGNGPGIRVLESAPSATRDIESIFNLSAYPNPASDRLNVAFVLERKSDVRLEIASLDGVVHIVDQQGWLAPGQYAFDLSVADLANGMYVLSLYANEQVLPMQFIKQ